MAHSSVRSVVIVGTGRMGSGIAKACAQSDILVHLVGRSFYRCEAVAQRINMELGIARVHASDLDSGPLGEVDLAIESVAEDPSLKMEVLSRLERCVSLGAIVASGTSSLSISELSSVLTRPGRFLGLHFLHPADSTRLVEVIPSDLTTGESVHVAREFVQEIGKRSIIVDREVPGFVWNRLQFALLREALHLVEEGVASAADIDLAVSMGLAPRWLAAGPLGTADLGGNELFASIAARLFPVLCRAQSIPDFMLNAADRGGLLGLNEAELAQLRRRRTEFLERGIPFDL